MRISRETAATRHGGCRKKLKLFAFRVVVERVAIRHGGIQSADYLDLQPGKQQVCAEIKISTVRYIPHV